MTLETFVEKRLQCGRLMRYFIGEFLATYFLVFLLLCAGVQRFLVYGSSPNYVEACLASGLAVSFSIYLAGKISGAHINPAVSLAFMLAGKINFLELFIYWIAQFISAFVAAATAFGLYYDSLTLSSPHTEWNVTSPQIQIFATFPRQHVSNYVAFIDQMFGSGLLILSILAITDSKNLRVHPGSVPLSVGLTVAMLGMTLSYNAGGAINPARDLAPRCFAALLINSCDVFAYHGFWGVLAVPAQLLGATISVAIYVTCIGGQLRHSRDEDLKNLADPVTLSVNHVTDFTTFKNVDSRFLKSEI